MTTFSPHPEAAQLWALADDASTVSARVVEHVQSCPECQARMEGMAQMRVALAADPHAPSAADTAAARVRLERALHRETRRSRRAWPLGRVAAAVIVAAAGGAAASSVMSDWWITRFGASGTGQALERATEALPPPAVPVAPQSAVQLLQVAPAAPSVSMEARQPSTTQRPRAPQRDAERASRQHASLQRAVPVPAKVPSRAAVSVRAPALRAERVVQGTGPTPAEAARAARVALEAGTAAGFGYFELAELELAAGAPDRAVGALVSALSGPRARDAKARLDVLASRDGTLARRALRATSGASAAEAARWACEWGLRLDKDRAAVERCRAFGADHASHPAVRTLALASAETAEVLLEDHVLAEREYGRAILLSELAGDPNLDALIGRARVRLALGKRDEARADLALFLSLRPAAKNRASVRALAQKLGLRL